MKLVVGRIGRAHGIRGDVFVEPFTDEPETRFAPGSVLAREGAEPLTVAAMKWHSGRMVVHFEGVDDRTPAEALRGGELTIEVDPTEAPTDPDEYYDHQLIGLEARLADGEPVGAVTEVVHLPGQDLLVVTQPDGAESLVPFVNAIVPTVDVAGGHVVLTPPAGLLNEAEAVVVEGEQ